jgi:hypothetical protein
MQLRAAIHGQARRGAGMGGEVKVKKGRGDKEMRGKEKTGKENNLDLNMITWPWSRPVCSIVMV